MLKKLLLAGSITALSAMSAHAQLSAELPEAAVVLTPALELDLPGEDPGFVFDSQVVIESGGSYPSGVPYLIDVTLPDGVTFATAVGVNNLRNDGFVGEPGGDLTTDVTISSGGAVGDSSVTFLVTSNPGVENLRYNGAFRLDACVGEDAGFEIGANLVAGVPISGGSATSDAIILECESAIGGEIDANTDEDGTPGELIINLGNDFETLDDDSLGTISYSIDDEVSITGEGTDLTAADIDSIAFDVVFEDVTGLAQVSVAGVSVDLTGTTASFVITDSDAIDDLLSDEAAEITLEALTGDDAAPIVAQSVSVTNAVVTFNDDTADLVATEDGAEGDLVNLQRDGQNFGPFDWNDGRAGFTTSVYRVTGFDPAEVVDYTVTLSNSNRDGSFTGTLTADAVGEFTMTSVGFGGVVGTYGRGDVSFNFERNGDLDVDRLMVRNGISTSFGGGANSDAEED